MTSRSKFYVVYGVFALAGLGLFCYLLQQGSVYFPSAGISLPGANAGQGLLPRLLLAIVFILIVTKTAAYLMKLVRQPPVIGEVLGGIVLGPTVFGRLLPEL